MSYHEETTVLDTIEIKFTSHGIMEILFPSFILLRKYRPVKEQAMEEENREKRSLGRSSVLVRRGSNVSNSFVSTLFLTDLLHSCTLVCLYVCDHILFLSKKSLGPLG